MLSIISPFSLLWLTSSLSPHVPPCCLQCSFMNRSLHSPLCLKGSFLRYQTSPFPPVTQAWFKCHSTLEISLPHSFHINVPCSFYILRLLDPEKQTLRFGFALPERCTLRTHPRGRGKQDWERETLQQVQITEAWTKDTLEGNKGSKMLPLRKGG